MKITVFAATLVLLGASLATAQWAPRPTPGVARQADGTVKRTAPPPRVHGKPDLSGVWMPRPDPQGKPEGVENEVLPRYMVNVAQDLPGDGFITVVAPAYAELFQERLRSEGADPIGHCKPAGAPRALSLPLPMKIVQTPELVMVLHEYDSTFRQIFTDGRALPVDPQPRFMGYSVGRWDRDTFVVTSTGFTEQAWLDAMGHPHSEALTMTERYRRVDTGHLDVTVTFADAKALREPITITQHFLLQPDQDLLEYFCAENEKDRQHYVPTN